MPSRTKGRGARRAVMPERSWEWQEHAACRGHSSDLFFGPEGEKAHERNEREKRAVVVCARCPVREKCAQHALGLPEIYGVWGGTTESGRSALRRRRLASSAA